MTWDREVVCCLPDYYRWNQWFFIKLYERGLAYRANAPVVWCPSCITVLANEQVLNGACERCGTVVTRRDLEQWFFRITDYADRLLDFSGLIEWPDKILTMQNNWIGKSTGVEISFDISSLGIEEREIRTFTTRIDTIFGVTFIVLAPEHSLVEQITTPQHRVEVEEYVDEARRTSEIDRLSADKEKTGVFTGSYAVNRLNYERVPIFISDYVLVTYGTGAVMGVPAHDARDFRVCPQVPPPHTAGHCSGQLGWQRPERGVPRRRIHDLLRGIRWHDQRGGCRSDFRRCRKIRLGQAGRLISYSRLAHLSPALLGHPHSHDLLR